MPILYTGQGNSNLRGIRHGPCTSKGILHHLGCSLVSLFLSGKKGSFKAQKKKHNSQNKLKMKEIGTGRSELEV